MTDSISVTLVVAKLTDIANDLDSAVAAIGDVRGRGREEVLAALSRIRETAVKAIDSIEKGKKRKAPRTTDAGFDLEHDWTVIVVRRE